MKVRQTHHSWASSLPEPNRASSGYSAYTDSEKQQIVNAYLQKKVRISILCQYFLVDKRTIYNWIRIFAPGNVTSNIRRASKYKVQNSTPMPRKKQNPAESPEEELARLRAENKRLQEALKMAEWSNHAKDKMIEIAEQTFNIPIRKKSGAKQ